VVEYRHTLDGIDETWLEGPFFVDWPNPPSPATHLRILAEADERVIAVSGDQVVGFVTALTDRVLTAYIPLLEVVPELQGKGIGSQLVEHLLGQLDGLYAVDVLCDPDLMPFYERFGFRPTTGASIRRYEHQAGREDH
jgi:predicted N-acetyltransferase YhbS